MDSKRMVKAKIIAKMIYKVGFEGRRNMEEMQEEVAIEINEQSGYDLEKAKDVVHFVVAEYIEQKGLQ